MHAQAIDAQLPAHELGLRFTGFDDFNIMYKVSKKPGTYRRHRFGQAYVNYNENNEDLDIALGYAFGVEKRRKLKGDLSLLTGPEFLLLVAYGTSDSGGVERNKQMRITPGIGWVIGFQLEVSQRVLISAEMIPTLSSTISRFNYTDNSYKFTLDINSNATGLTVMYRI